MKGYFIVLFCFCLFGMVGNPALATTIKPVSLEDQIRDASGIIHGRFVSKRSKKLSNGSVISELNFKLIKSVGIKQSTIVNKNYFLVVIPGGIWQGIVYHIHGVPSFIYNEEVVLILSKTKDGFTVKDLGLGKYNVHHDRSGKMTLSSALFPDNPYLNNIKYDKINELSYVRFGKFLNSVNSDKYIFNRKEFAQSSLAGRRGRRTLKGTMKENRSPASELENKAEDAEDQSSGDARTTMFWLTVFLAFLGFYSTSAIRSKK